MLNIAQQLFLNEHEVTENHLIQSWLKKVARYANTNIFTIQNCIFDHEVSLSDCWNTILHEILKVSGKFGLKNYARPWNIVVPILGVGVIHCYLKVNKTKSN